MNRFQKWFHWIRLPNQISNKVRFICDYRAVALQPQLKRRKITDAVPLIRLTNDLMELVDVIKEDLIRVRHPEGETAAAASTGAAATPSTGVASPRCPQQQLP